MIICTNPTFADLIEPATAVAGGACRYLGFATGIPRIDRGFDTTVSSRAEFVAAVQSEATLRVLLAASTKSDWALRDALAMDVLRAGGVPVVGPTARAVRVANDKLETKRILVEAGVPVLPDASRGSGSVGSGLVVIKPRVSAGGGTGLRYVLGAELAQEELSDVVVEPFIRGYELTLNVVRHSQRTYVFPALFKGWTDAAGHHPVHRVRVSGPLLSMAAVDTLGQLAGACGSALGIEGNFDIDLIVTDRGPVVLEVNVRPSASLRVVARTTDVNPFELLLHPSSHRPTGEELTNVVATRWGVELPLLQRPAGVLAAEHFVHEFALPLRFYGKLALWAGSPAELVHLSIPKAVPNSVRRGLASQLIDIQDTASTYVEENLLA